MIPSRNTPCRGKGRNTPCIRSHPVVIFWRPLAEQPQDAECQHRSYSSALFTTDGKPGPTIKSREEVALEWRPRPSRQILARARRNSGEEAWDRVGEGLRDGLACRNPCGAPGRIADKWRPTLPYECLDEFSRGLKLPRWK